MKNFLKCWLFLATLLLVINVFAKSSALLDTIAFTDLPKEAQKTVLLIKHGGPYPYEKDGVVFGNYEGVLPEQKRGYYHEFTVKTSGARSRGAKRIVTGGPLRQPREFYYTDNHYATFKRIIE